jgi:putative DNA primase/helicase
MANGVLHLDGPILVSHTPAWFNLHALPFGYDPQAQAPEWHQFLEVALEGDEQRTALLQEWFGYVLVGGTDLQKMLSVFGPKRCGKGTVMRVLREMIGSRYAVAPSSLDSLGGTFGMQQLIGARLATFGDVQWTGRNLNEVVGILLGISGEDAQTIQRKNRDEWTGTLPVRFMFSGNDRPRFKNTSGALASRFLYLRFRVSMIGREDHGLTGKLLLELPGIFNWALAGWDRLGKNGGVFTDSDLGREDRREVERHASPTLAFVEDRCVIAQDAEVDMDELYEKYTKWRADEGLSYASGKPSFARDLASSVPSIVTKRVGSSRAGRKQVVFGMRLATSADQAPDQADQADQASKVDLTQEELPVQSMCGPGGPGGPGKNTDYQPENKTSYESTRSEKVQPTLGNLPGPLGPPGPGMPLSSEDSRTTMNTPAWSDKWAGIEDLIDQENY